MQGFVEYFVIFHNEFDKLGNTEAQRLDCFNHMALKTFEILFLMLKHQDFAIYTQYCYGRHYMLPKFNTLVYYQLYYILLFQT